MPKIHLHHLTHSRSFRIVWLLEALKETYGVEYEIMCYQRNKTHLAPKALSDIHPMGKAPIVVIERPNQEKLVLAESALIIEYLLNHYDKDKRFYPSDDKAWQEYTFWLHFAEGSLMPPLVMTLILGKSVERSPFFVRPIIKGLKRKIGALILDGNISKSLTLLESSLKDRHWLTGDKLTGADIQLYFAVAAARQRVGLLEEQHSNIINWLTRCESQNSFKTAVAVGGTPF